MERLRGGGKHKDKTSKAEKRQVAKQELVNGDSPAIPEGDKGEMIHMLEEDDRKTWVGFWSKGSDAEVEQKMHSRMTKLLEPLEVDKKRADI